MTLPTDGRFALRFESGERAGETVAVTHSGMVLGRRPGTSLQIVEPSVSGRHAELLVDDAGVTIRDLGSTNGTRVGRERIEERRLAHGDAVSIGNVQLTFLDTRVAAGAGRDAGEIDLEGGDDLAVEPFVERAPDGIGEPIGGPGAGAGEAVHHVSADRVARSGRRSILPLLGVVVLLAGGAGAWLLLRPGARAGGRAVAAVQPVAGDLLAASHSFEGEGAEEAWQTDEEAVAAFAVSPGASRSGDQCLVTDLAAGEWSRAASELVRAPLDGKLELRGFLRLEGAARARLGVRFTASRGGPSPVEALAEPRGETDGFEEVALTTPVPPGYDRAQAVVLAVAEATGDGATVAVDDVSLVPAGRGAAAASFLENRLHLLGDPAYAASLFEIDTVVLSGVAAIDSTAPELGGVTPLEAADDPAGVVLRLGAGGGADRLALRAEPAALTGGVATIGAGGYRTHAAQFEREGVESLLVGAGRDLVRLAFAQPTHVVGRPAGEGFRIEVGARPGDELRIQLGFREERAAAAGLAARARNAEREGRHGETLALWQELLDDFPYERSLVEEAEEARSRLVQSGMRELEGLGDELERARFFGLAELFREVRGRVRDVEARFEGSEVADAGRELAASIDAELAGLEDDRHTLERERLQAILSTLKESEMTELASAVQGYLAELGGPTGAGPDGAPPGGESR